MSGGFPYSGIRSDLTGGYMNQAPSQMQLPAHKPRTLEIKVKVDNKVCFQNTVTIL